MPLPTTIEALWQGVPVVSLAGRPSVGRFGAMILHAVGMDDWVSEGADGYVACAVAAAADTRGLARIRATLRQRVADSSAVRCSGPCAARRGGLSRALRSMLTIAPSARGLALSRISRIRSAVVGSSSRGRCGHRCVRKRSSRLEGRVVTW